MFRTTKMNTLLLASALGLGLTAAAPAVADLGDFSSWDTNNDGYVQMEEYEQSSFGIADTDSDGYLEDVEYATYTENYYDPYDISYDSYTAYDTDGDGYINQTEFYDMPTADVYSSIDTDDNDYLTEDEWDQASIYYSDYENDYNSSSVYD